jgi:lipopolysaccharide transport system permease protein
MLQQQIYRKSNQLGFFTLVRGSLRDLRSSNFLAVQFAKRDISAQYRQSYLGILWLFITPIANALIWIVLNKSGTISIPDTGIPYPVYAFSGTLIWSILVEAINSPTQSTNAARSILSKINFPKEALVLSGLYKLLFNSSVKVLLLVLFVFIFGVGFHWSLLLVPFALIGLVLVGTAIGLFLTPIGLLYNDVSRLTTMALSLLMYATPVVYGISKDGIMKVVMEYNPFTPLITTVRALLVGQQPPFLEYFLVLSFLSIIVLLVSLVIYRVAIPIIVERLSA